MSAIHLRPAQRIGDGPTHRTNIGIVSLITICLGLSAACTHQPDHNANRHKSQTPDPVGPIKALTYPEMDTVDGAEKFTRIKNTHLVSCMAAKGYANYQPTTHPREIYTQDEAFGNYGTALGDENYRTTHGYGATIPIVARVDSTQEETPLSTTPEDVATREATSQDAAECVAQFQDNTPTELEEANQAETLSENKAAIDPGFIEAREQWPSCMQEKGYAFKDSAEASASIDERVRPFIEQGEIGTPDALALRDEELALAQADWECQQPAVYIYQTQRNQYQQEFLDANPEFAGNLEAAMRSFFSQ